MASVAGKKSGDADPKLIAVSELTRRLKGTVEPAFADLWVSGELSGFRGAHSSGHIYCTLKDRDSQIPLVMWRSNVARLPVSLAEGIEVRVHGNVEIYAPQGKYQFIADAIQPKGIGALQLAFQKLCERLREEGLFDRERKRALPLHPRRIGIVTAPTGAAIRDMLTIMKRRDPRLGVVIYPARVQGEGAKEQIARGIVWLNANAERLGLDLIIVGRGGGSLEDLWAFNEEIVARAIFASELPVVSAVGHEVDTTVADYVADVRAATPSEAAELVVPELAALLEVHGELSARLGAAASAMVEARRESLDGLARRIESHSPTRRLHDAAQRLDELSDRLTAAARRAATERHHVVGSLSARLDGLSPLRVLARGYSVARKASGGVVKTIGDVKPGDELSLRVADGTVLAAVSGTQKS